MKKNTYLWLLLALLGAGLILAGCAMSHIQPDGTLITTGQDILPGGGEITQDVAGAISDAAAKVNPTEVIQKVVDRDWMGLGAILVGFAAAIGGGIFARRKIRAASGKTVIADKTEPPVEE